MKGWTAGGSAVSSGNEPMRYRVLFVCTGNICRSAYADVVAPHAGLAGVEFSSAGTQALVGRLIDPPMAQLVGDRGDPSTHRAQQLTRELMTESDLVLAMSANHRRYILDEWPVLGRKAFIIGQAAREMERLPESTTLETLVKHLWQHRSRADGDEVADPYMLGPDAAQEAARAIDAHLESILGGLGSLLDQPNS